MANLFWAAIDNGDYELRGPDGSLVARVYKSLDSHGDYWNYTRWLANGEVANSFFSYNDQYAAMGSVQALLSIDGGVTIHAGEAHS